MKKQIQTLGLFKIFNIIFSLYWICAAAFFNLFYGRPNTSREETLMYTVAYFCIAFVCVDIHHRFITQPNIPGKKYFRFGMFSLFLFIGAFWLEAFTSFILHFYFLDVSDSSKVVEPVAMVRRQIGGVNMVVFGGVALRMMNELLSLHKKYEQKERQSIESQLRLKEVELEQLKGQLNPHFLFNALNCIYGLSLEKSEQTPEITLQLSSILDYCLYRCQHDVRLSEELEQMQNYVAIQKERFGQMLQLSFQTSVDTDRKIAPLLFFTLLENAFKHARPNQKNQIEIEIQLQSKGNQVQFQVGNTTDDESALVRKTSQGIGIENLKRRLELLYPQQYDFSIQNTAHYYRTSLTLFFKPSHE